VVYYENFGKSRLTELARDFPQRKDFLDALNARVWDQLEVFKQALNDHRLALSKSIKVVLPTFVPNLSYKNLNVQKGDQAQLQWKKMIDIKWGPAKTQEIEDLLAYCKLDTLAMVELHGYLESLVD